MPKSLEIDKETTVAIGALTKTDENRLHLMQMMAQLYREKGSVEEQDIQKLDYRKTKTTATVIHIKGGVGRWKRKERILRLI